MSELRAMSVHKTRCLKQRIGLSKKSCPFAKTSYISDKRLIQQLKMQIEIENKTKTQFQQIGWLYIQHCPKSYLEDIFQSSLQPKALDNNNNNNRD